MESFFDLPTHVFLVHIPVVLTPLVCAAAVAVALRPRWRRRYGTLLVLAALVVMVSTLLAVKSGQTFNDAIDADDIIEHHKNLGETTRLFVIGLFLVSSGLVGAGRRHDASVAVDDAKLADEGARSSGPLMYGLAGATVVLAVLSTVWVVRTGHEGAKVHWDGYLPDAAAAESDEAAIAASSTTSEPPAIASTTSEPPATSSSTTPGDAPGAEIDGTTVFADNCARCHGATGEGGRGPALIGNDLGAAQIQAQVRVGGNGMLSFQTRLSDPEIAAVVEFVEAL